MLMAVTIIIEPNANIDRNVITRIFGFFHTTITAQVIHTPSRINDVIARNWLVDMIISITILRMKKIEEILSQSQAATDFLGDGFEIFRLAGDASSREYFRILYGKQETCALMLLPEGAASLAEEYESDKVEITEYPFVDVQRLLASKNVRVPDIFVSDVAHRVLLIEDLGDEHLHQVLANKPKEYLEQAITLLSSIVNPHPETLTQSIAFQRAFDTDLYMWEFEHFLEYGISALLDSKPTDIEALREHFANITSEYVKWDLTLCHRDFHSKNLLLLDDNTMAVIDFQDALMGPVYYDLVSLLKDAYTSIDRSMQEDMVRSYQAMLHDDIADKKCSHDEFMYRFDLMSLHRNLKAAGRFVYIDQVKNNPHYLKDVPQCVSYCLQTLSLHKELHGLESILKPYLESLMKEV